MAIGPLARLLAQVVVPVIAVLVRALPAAYAQALHHAQKNGATAATASSSLRNAAKVSRQEAMQILNLAETEATAEAIERQYERYMAANAVSSKSGGSYYLQSKVYRAREMLVDFSAEQRRQEQQQQQPKGTPPESKNDDDGRSKEKEQS